MNLSTIYKVIVVLASLTIVLAQRSRSRERRRNATLSGVGLFTLGIIIAARTGVEL